MGLNDSNLLSTFAVGGVRDDGEGWKEGFFMGTVMGRYLDDPVQKALGRKCFLSLFFHECAVREGVRCGGA